MRDVVVAAAAGYSRADLQLWARSLRDSGFRGDAVLLCRRIAASTQDAMRSLGVSVVDLDPTLSASEPQIREDADMSVERFYFVWRFLRDLPADQYRFLVLTDSRDVVFQADPTEWLARHLGEHGLVVASEGIRLEDEPWNAATLRKGFAAAIVEEACEYVVYNAGVIGGRFDVVRDLALNLYLASPGATAKYSDQLALNVLLRLAPYRDLTLLAGPAEAWSCNADVLARHPEHLIEPEPVFSPDGLVRNQAGDHFVAVHQYDRIPAWADAYRARWGDGAEQERPADTSPPRQGLRAWLQRR